MGLAEDRLGVDFDYSVFYSEAVLSASYINTIEVRYAFGVGEYYWEGASESSVLEIIMKMDGIMLGQTFSEIMKMDEIIPNLTMRAHGCDGMRMCGAQVFYQSV